MFENSSLAENPSLLESLSCNIHSLTDIFAELHLKESPSPSSFPEISSTNLTHNHSKEYVSNSSTPTTPHKNSDSSLHLCTEGLGFESSDDVEDSKNGGESGERETDDGGHKKSLGLEGCCDGEWRRKSSIRVNNGVEYPPPISCIGKSGKPCVSFMSYRDNGRFVLKEVRSPVQEFLHAHREDGRLKLHFVHPEYEDFVEEQTEDGDHSHEEESLDDGEQRVVIENDQTFTDISYLVIEEKGDYV
ncbi:hypothetical protein VNO78_05853 [Psophocarpus tetragonolobus]|uniref:FAF domain-containing protein n=1 Tax=Psophocarpus tetragonolobus TaxID=3891 RepID=A0AAN9T1C5_PSOTE